MQRLRVQNIADTIIITIERCAHVILRIGSTVSLILIGPLIVVVIGIEYQVGGYSVNNLVRIAIAIGIQPSSWIVWEGVRTCSTDTSW